MDDKGPSAAFALRMGKPVSMADDPIRVDLMNCLLSIMGGLLRLKYFLPQTNWLKLAGKKRNYTGKP